MPTEPTPQRNIVDSALEAGRRMAVEVIESPLDNGKPFVVLRDASGAERVEYIEAQFDIPARKTGDVKLNDESSFVAYWKLHAIKHAALIYGSITPARFLAVFNDHRGVDDGGLEFSADYRDFRATYELRHSKEWGEWTGKNSTKFDGTVAFAEWLENHVPDVVRPEGAKMLEIALNLRVTANAAYSKAVRLSDGHTELTYTNQVDGSAHAAGGKVTIPEQFCISVPVFEGLGVQKYDVEARFRYRLNGSTLSLWYELVRPHKVVEQAFADILARIEREADTKVLFGSPE